MALEPAARPPALSMTRHMAMVKQTAVEATVTARAAVRASPKVAARAAVRAAPKVAARAAVRVALVRVAVAVATQATAPRRTAGRHVCVMVPV